MIDPYLLWKTMHIISASILFGTGLGIAFFAWFGYRHALRVGEIEGLKTVLRITVIADLCFTAPAVVFQLLSGVVLIHIAGWALYSPWSITTFGLFFLVGLLWLPVVLIQIMMSREAQQVRSIKELSTTFHRRFVLWFILGVPAFLIVIVIFFLMVVKPLSFMF